MENMQIGYMRATGAGMTVKAQKAALSSIGLDVTDKYGPVYLDDRNQAIASLEAGDVLAIASASCLGHPESDVLAALEAVGRRGAVVLDVETGETVKWHPDAQAPLAFAVRAGSTSRKAIAAKARAARAATGNYGQKPFEWDRKTTDQLKSMLKSGELTRQGIADELGVSRATLQRKLREMTSNKGAD